MNTSDTEAKLQTAAKDQTKKIVTVHGTGAGDTTATGDRWWQLGSRFEAELSKRLKLNESDAILDPFQWEDGPNSESARREAGGELLTKLLEHEENGTEYYLIGHSHGGSVIYHALFKAAAMNLDLPYLKQWCTVGTPYLEFRPNKRLWQRLSSTALTFLLSGIVAWLVAISYWIAQRFTNWTTDVTQEAFLQALAIILALYGVVCTLALIVWERRFSGWATKTQLSLVDRAFAKRWVGFWHPEDEAISALINVKTVSGAIVPSSFLTPIASGVQFAIVSGLGLWVAWDTIHNGTVLENLADSFHYAADVFATGKLSLEVVLFVLVCCSILLGSTLILLGAWVLGQVLFLIGVPLAALVNRIIWLSVRERAWGDDLSKERVQFIAAHPPAFSRVFQPLPEYVADPLRTHSDSNAIDTLNKVRLILGMSRDASVSSDIKTELSESLKWKELIHTSYFDVPEFIEILVLVLSRAGLAPLADSFATARPETDDIRTWLANHHVG